MKGMRYSDLVEGIKRIANISDPEECQKSLRKLIKYLDRPNFEARMSGNWVFFYMMEVFYDSETQNAGRKPGESLGKLPKEEYLKDKEKYNSMSLKELRKVLILVEKK